MEYAWEEQLDRGELGLDLADLLMPRFVKRVELNTYRRLLDYRRYKNAQLARERSLVRDRDYWF